MSVLVTLDAQGKREISPELVAHWTRIEPPLPSVDAESDALRAAQAELERAKAALARSEDAYREASARRREQETANDEQRLRTITLDTGDKFTTRRTPYVPVAAGRMGRWYILSGFNGKLLAIHEVTEYRKRYASLIWTAGGSVPVEVSIALQREFELERAS